MRPACVPPPCQGGFSGGRLAAWVLRPPGVRRLERAAGRRPRPRRLALLDSLHHISRIHPHIKL